MHLIYFDESGQSGRNLHDAGQPIFVLAALIVPEETWLPLERELQHCIARFFPNAPAQSFEVHATKLRNGEGMFRQYRLDLRLEFISCWLEIAQRHGLKLVYRAIAKRRFRTWMESAFPSGVLSIPMWWRFPWLRG